jgi:hypothetical protein
VAVSENKKKVCQTVIPKDWPQFTGGEYIDGMTVSQANDQWRQYMRNFRKLLPTMKVYR